MIYFYHYGFMDIYFIHWVIIPYCFVYFAAQIIPDMTTDNSFSVYLQI